MIVNLNGWPGVGKFTTARELSKLIDGTVLDNHTILTLGAPLRGKEVQNSTPWYEPFVV